jgi:hypothetical protein
MCKKNVYSKFLPENVRGRNQLEDVCRWEDNIKMDLKEI